MTRVQIRSKFGVLAAAAAAAVVGLSAGSARAGEETAAELQLLKARIAQLEAKQAEAATAAETRRTVADVLADADRRSQLLQAGGGLTGGYDKGFFIQSEDKKFVLRPGVMFQFRGVANSADDAQPDGDRDNQLGFEVRRARFRFDGNVFGPDLTYSFVWDTNRQGGGVSLLDAWAAYKVAPDWQVKVGQFKESWSQEKNLSFTGQLAVDRSLVDTLVGGNLTDRVQGVAGIYGGTKDNPLRVEVALHDGANSKNTNFQDETSTAPGSTLNPANFGVGGRVEYKLFGDWANYRSDFSAKGNKDNLLVVGGGFDFTQRGDGDTTLATVDAQYETNTGFNAYAGIIGNFVGNAAGADRTDYGLVVQAGYLFNPAWEGFARYDVVLLDDDFVTGEDTFHEFTVGVNYFLGDGGSALHRAKITADVGYLPNGSPSAQTGIGVVGADDAQFVFRAQFQLQL